MTSWAQRARAHFQQERPYSTTETTESPLSIVLTVQSEPFCEKHDFQNQTELAANDSGTVLTDRLCWPHSDAMTDTEIDAFTARLTSFTSKGVIHSGAESLADKLVTRDRDGDDRRLCLECRHIGGFASASWRCGNWMTAGIAQRARDAQIGAELPVLLQRCAGFSDGTNQPGVTG